MALMVPIVVSCTEKREEARDDWKSMVSEAAHSKWGNAGRVYLDLRETPFGWDTVYFFGPYTSTASIDDALGFRWSRARRIRIDERDGINLLVFVKRSKVVAYIEHPRVEGDFSKIDMNEMTPEEAFFEVREEMTGGPWLYFYQVPREDYDN